MKRLIVLMMMAVIITAVSVIPPAFQKPAFPHSVNCVGEGESIPVIPNAPSCCKGLTLVKPKDSRIVGSQGICTSTCGNGVCDRGTESAYNCPKDCKSTTYRDVPFGFHTGNAFPKDIAAHNPDNPLDPEIWGKYEYAEDIGIGWERPGMYAWIPPQRSGLSWQQLTDRIYSAIPASMRIFANIDLRVFTVTRPASIPTETASLTVYHPPVSSLELFDEKLYVQFVRDLVERYDGDGVGDMPGLKNLVKYWQVDNELPGLPPFEINSSNQAKNDKWLKTSTDNYAHVLDITSKAIKTVNPSAKIALSGMADIGPGTAGLFHQYYLKILEKLKGKQVDIFDYHFYGDAKNSWKTMKDAYRMIREGLDSIGYKDMEIWITETGTYTGRPRDVQGYAPLQTEKEQAVDLVKRLIYPLTFGVKRVFWAWGIVDCAASEGPDGYMGLIYNGKGPDNPGYGVKKLSYYAYKKMVEILDGSDWNNIQTIKEEQNDGYGIFLYKFTRNGKPVYVGWFDCFDERKCSMMKIDLRAELAFDRDVKTVKITEAVPKYKSGKEVTDYGAAFNSEAKAMDGSKITIALKETPVFVEGK
jgi:hypothetical protein